MQTTEQQQTLEALSSVIDMTEAEVTDEKNGTVIFEGYSADGLAVGIIDEDGEIEWVCGKIETPAPKPRTDLVILRPWRDGSVHAEVPTVAYHDEDDVLLVHAEDRKQRLFTTLCGGRYGGKGSVTSYSHPHTVSCEKCRKILLGA